MFASISKHEGYLCWLHGSPAIDMKYICVSFFRMLFLHEFLHIKSMEEMNGMACDCVKPSSYEKINICGLQWTLESEEIVVSEKCVCFPWKDCIFHNNSLICYMLQCEDLVMTKPVWWCSQDWNHTLLHFSTNLLYFHEDMRYYLFLGSDEPQIIDIIAIWFDS